MGDRNSIGSSSGFKSGGRSSVGSDNGFKPTNNGRPSTGSNSGFVATKGPPEVDAFGGSNLEAKQKYVEDHYDGSLSIENLEELGDAMRKFFSEDLPAGTRSAMKSVKETLTPGFIRRFQNKKIHAQEVEDREL
jgi:hypothetical protein